MKKLRNLFSHFKPLLDLNTAAALIGCSVSTITRMCEDGSLPYVCTHRGKRKVTRKIRPSSLSAFLAGNTVRAMPGKGGNLAPIDDSKITDKDIEALLDESASVTTAAEESNVANP